MSRLFSDAVFEEGDRVCYAWIQKGTIRETRRTNGGYLQHTLNWDSPLMSPTMWIDEWELKLIPILEQLAEQAE